MRKAKSVPKPSPAQALIARARVPYRKIQDPPRDGWLEALKELIVYNDSVGSNQMQRVNADSAIEMLRTQYGWSGSNGRTLDRLCARTYGRKSYAKA